jgi:hypothetical protein
MKGRLHVSTQTTRPPIATEIRYQGRHILITTPYVRRLLRQGLRPVDCEMIALTAHAHRMSVAELCALALEGQVTR